MGTFEQLSPQVWARLVREARDYFDGYDIDWSRYEEPALEVARHASVAATWPRVGVNATEDDGVSTKDAVFDLIWTRYDNPEIKLILSNVWFSPKNGRILQAGSNYGYLTI